MDLVRTRAAVPRLEEVVSTGSTNTDLLALAADPTVPTGTVLLTTDQRKGRGRLDRSWVAPPGAAVAVSLLIRNVLADPAASWVPLAGGAALVEALEMEWPGRFGFKWPNDVLVDGLKLAGVLTEVSAGGDAVIGMGLNVGQTADELPVPTATSLRASGFPHDEDVVDRILAAYVTRLRSLLTLPIDPEIRDVATRRCITLGQRVRVEIPSGGALVGVADRLDLTGRLIVRTDEGEVTVSAGDVIHVRRAD